MGLGRSDLDKFQLLEVYLTKILFLSNQSVSFRLSQQFAMPAIPEEVRSSSKKKRQNGVILTSTPQVDAAVTSANSDASTSLLFVPPMINQNFPSGTTSRIEPWHLLQVKPLQT